MTTTEDKVPPEIVTVWVTPVLLLTATVEAGTAGVVPVTSHAGLSRAVGVAFTITEKESIRP